MCPHQLPTTTQSSAWLRSNHSALRGTFASFCSSLFRSLIIKFLEILAYTWSVYSIIIIPPLFSTRIYSVGNYAVANSGGTDAAVGSQLSFPGCVSGSGRSAERHMDCQRPGKGSGGGSSSSALPASPFGCPRCARSHGLIRFYRDAGQPRRSGAGNGSGAGAGTGAGAGLLPLGSRCHGALCCPSAPLHRAPGPHSRLSP